MIASFLTLSRSFTNPITQVSNQFNSIVMALAGAERIFAFMDEQPETDDGYVTLVNAREEKRPTDREPPHAPVFGHGSIPMATAPSPTPSWQADVAVRPCGLRLRRLKKIVLHDITLYAEPGQKIAFVGATGAGKTTITNLINRFYDIADGKIRYDGININKIKKADLRRSLGIVLQDTNLFTGTVMENIRYGKLDATDEECIAAAKLANADDFIRTPARAAMIPCWTGDGSESVAGTAPADRHCPRRGGRSSGHDSGRGYLLHRYPYRSHWCSRAWMRLMEGRTVFVIAHRLSTVQNSDVIMVLEHGRIIERGSHEKLIEEKGTYYRLYTGAFELE